MLNIEDIYRACETPIIKNQIAKRLHHSRKACNLSQEDVANELCCKRQTVASWEKGWKQSETAQNVIPRLDQIIDLCKLYNCDPGYLLCLYDSHYLPFETACNITGLSEESITVLKEFADRIKKEAPHESSQIRFILSFLNYLIPRLPNFLASTNLYTKYIDKTDALDRRENKAILLKAFNQGAPTSDARAPGDTPSNYLHDYYISNGYDEHDASTLSFCESVELDTLNESNLKLAEISFNNDMTRIVGDFFTFMHKARFSFSSLSDTQINSMQKADQQIMDMRAKKQKESSSTEEPGDDLPF